MKTLLAIVLPSVSLPLLLSCTSAPESRNEMTSIQTGTTGRASYSVTTRDGVKIVELTLKDRNGNESLALSVAPEAGSNIVSLRYHGIEVLEQPKSYADIAKQDAGIEFLYPTPNRVRNGELAFKDLKLKFTPNLEGHFIHGLAREYAWSFDTPLLSETKIVYRTWFEMAEGSDVLKRFPFKNRLSMTLTLEGERVQFDFKVENLDLKNLPFGFGIHPYFVLHGQRADTSVWMHVASQMEANELIPTGKVLPLAETKFARLPKGMTVQDVLGADTVFWPTRTDHAAEVREPGMRLEISASKDFGHTVLWAPKVRDLFAVENQTSSTDAHNLANRGFKKESGLLELAPSASWTGWVRYDFKK